MTNIRKDNKVTARTVSGVSIVGVVTGVEGDKIHVETTTGNIEAVRESAKKLSAVDYKLALESVLVAKTVTTDVVEVVQEVNKKVLTGAVYARLVGNKRKVITDAMISEVGVSRNCANTYYQSFKSGKWVTA